jgi:hypothetical protein
MVPSRLVRTRSACALLPFTAALLTLLLLAPAALASGTPNISPLGYGETEVLYWARPGTRLRIV